MNTSTCTSVSTRVVRLGPPTTEEFRAAQAAIEGSVMLQVFLSLKNQRREWVAKLQKAEAMVRHMDGSLVEAFHALTPEEQEIARRFS